MIRCFFFAVFFLPILSCTKSKDDLQLNKFADTILIRIADFQDQRLGDSLMQYMHHVNPAYRKNAAIAYSSIQDSAYVKSLAELLNDNDSLVRKAAVFALGQTPSKASEKILLEACGKEKSKLVLTEAIESYGKVATIWKLDKIVDDSLISSALAWSYYRMGVRGLAGDLLNAMCSKFLSPRYSKSTRLGAAHYFARGAKGFEAYENPLVDLALHDISPEVRMASVLALRKINSPSSLAACVKVIGQDNDERARLNAIRSLQTFPFSQTRETLINALDDSAINVGIGASEVIKESITREFWSEINAIAQRTKNWRIQANLYEAALAGSDRKELIEEIQSAYNTSNHPYQKAALLTALQHSLLSYQFVQEKLFQSKEPVIKLAAATSLTAMNLLENFDHSLKSRFAKIYKAAIEDGDVAVVGTITDALVNPKLNYKSELVDFSFLYDAKKKLRLPRDYEAIAPLEMAIAYFEGKNINPSVPKNSFNHPIPWGLVKKIPRDQKAVIKTSKGNITIRLFVEEAPGSVANFISLALSSYYNNKFIHRVVPNFVVQAGCNRGDGWGSEDYSIRSEFSYLRYTTGSLGMASAGKDTEGTQWFITHSPTPHLDGRYTLFAEVISGMDIVNKIEVGDKIVSVDIINFKPL